MEKRKMIGRYPADVSKVFKGSKSLHCQLITDSSGIETIYFCDGFCLLTMCRMEYDRIARPIVKCDPGNWRIDDGVKQEGGNIDAQKVFNKYFEKTRPVLLERSSILFKRDAGNTTALFNPETKKLIYANEKYVDFIGCGCQLFGDSALDPVYVGRSSAELHALFLPIRNKCAEFEKAAAAYFSQDATPADDLRPQLEALEAEKAATVERVKEALETVESMKARLQALEDENSALKAAKAAPAAAVEAVKDPAAAVEAAEEKFRAIPGAVVTVKGRQTAAPVIWISGGDADAVKAAGGRWSDKKQAHYFKIA